MDTYTQAVTSKRRYLPLEQKRQIVEETLAEGASVARIALAHGVNANLVFNWRRLYQKGLLGGGPAKLLPVQVTAESSPAWTGSRDAACNFRTSAAGAIQIQLRNAQVRRETGAAALTGASATPHADACTDPGGLSRLRGRVTQAERRCF